MCFIVAYNSFSLGTTSPRIYDSGVSTRGQKQMYIRFTRESQARVSTLIITFKVMLIMTMFACFYLKVMLYFRKNLKFPVQNPINTLNYIDIDHFLKITRIILLSCWKFILRQMHSHVASCMSYLFFSILLLHYDYYFELCFPPTT